MFAHLIASVEYILANFHGADRVEALTGFLVDGWT
ncbi:gp37 [Rhodococcus phage ReqiPine5]|uniref:Gp37 n=1 Tax=Rhodococcus phage ReqiPine5 TaxID=691963 RepID=D4P812_9CAUD|nr:gp37 [Rhodococcus phage ReqiPine5]ADD81142.1 gp37 [Rhodococcus phage ReqiPine5]